MPLLRVNVCCLLLVGVVVWCWCCCCCCLLLFAFVRCCVLLRVVVCCRSPLRVAVGCCAALLVVAVCRYVFVGRCLVLRVLFSGGVGWCCPVLFVVVWRCWPLPGVFVVVCRCLGLRAVARSSPVLCGIGWCVLLPVVVCGCPSVFGFVV